MYVFDCLGSICAVHYVLDLVMLFRAFRRLLLLFIAFECVLEDMNKSLYVCVSTSAILEYFNVF